MPRALRESLGAKPFERISIREITRYAGVSYPTFFRNYSSKGDLLGDIGRKEIRQLLGVMASLVDREGLYGFSPPHLGIAARMGLAQLPRDTDIGRVES